MKTDVCNVRTYASFAPQIRCCFSANSALKLFRNRLELLRRFAPQQYPDAGFTLRPLQPQYFFAPPHDVPVCIQNGRKLEPIMTAATFCLSVQLEKWLKNLNRKGRYVYITRWQCYSYHTKRSNAKVTRLHASSSSYDANASTRQHSL